VYFWRDLKERSIDIERRRGGKTSIGEGDIPQDETTVNHSNSGERRYRGGCQPKRS